jgi:hypothetical protein
MRIQDEAPLTLVAVVRGEAWIVPDERRSERLGPGDVAIVRGPEPYVVADDPPRRRRPSSTPASAARRRRDGVHAHDRARRADVGDRPGRGRRSC